MGIVSPHTFLLPYYTYDLSPFLGVLNLASTPHNITIATLGVTNDNWQISANLLLWRSSGLKVAGARPTVTVSPDTTKPLSSSCAKVQNQPLTVQGSCVVKLQNRKMTASAQLTAGGAKLDAVSSYEVTSYTNKIVYDNSKGREEFKSTTAGKASWSLTRASARLRMRNAGSNFVMGRRRVTLKPETTVTAASATFNWLLGGSTSAGSVYELSDNGTIAYPWTMATLDAVVTKGAAESQPTARTSNGGTQKHYLHLRVPGAAEFTPEYGLCPVPPYATATVTLESDIHTMSWVPDVDCVHRGASAAFCYSKLLTDTTTARSDICSK
jgi:hypothetical protein